MIVTPSILSVIRNDEKSTRIFLFVVYFESIKRELKIKPNMSVGVMKDYELKLRDLHASHTMGWSWNWNT